MTTYIDATYLGTSPPFNHGHEYMRLMVKQSIFGYGITVMATRSKFRPLIGTKLTYPTFHDFIKDWQPTATYELVETVKQRKGKDDE